MENQMGLYEGYIGIMEDRMASNIMENQMNGKENGT